MTKYKCFSFIRRNVDATWQNNLISNFEAKAVFKEDIFEDLGDIEGRCQLLSNLSFYQSKIKVADATSH